MPTAIASTCQRSMPILPPREHHPDYARGDLPEELYVPSVY